MKVNSVHKLGVVHRKRQASCYLKALAGSLTVLVLTWTQLDVAKSFRYFFDIIINSVQ